MKSQILQKLVGTRIQEVHILGNGDLEYTDGLVATIQDHMGNPMLVSDQGFTYVMTPDRYDHYLETGCLANSHASSYITRLVK